MCAATIDMKAEFKALCKYGEQQAREGSFDTARKKENEPFNAEGVVKPFDGTIPKFSFTESYISQGGSDDEGDKPTEHTRTYNYYNASTVLGGRAIAAQGPEPAMLGAFFAMINEVGVNSIVTLCHEGDDYWSRYSIEDKPEVRFDIQGIKLLKTTLNLPNVERTITHYYLDKWPDGGTIPTEVLSQTITAVGKVTGPLLVHCVAGIGRTGTFLAAYGAYLDPGKDIRDITHSLRSRDTGRFRMICSQEQLELAYDVAAVVRSQSADLA
ncbi:MAG: tyrosine-protein phosphatase [Simkaniaceae bacterium]|nr:tyrosine-protein phosphatase [Candidatus Sacchlamyda saccharinae]